MTTKTSADFKTRFAVWAAKMEAAHEGTHDDFDDEAEEELFREGQALYAEAAPDSTERDQVAGIGSYFQWGLGTQA